MRPCSLEENILRSAIAKGGPVCALYLGQRGEPATCARDLSKQLRFDRLRKLRACGKANGSCLMFVLTWKLVFPGFVMPI